MGPLPHPTHTQLLSIKEASNKNKHCQVLVSCSDRVLGNYIELHVTLSHPMNVHKRSPITITKFLGLSLSTTSLARFFMYSISCILGYLFNPGLSP